MLIEPYRIGMHQNHFEFRVSRCKNSTETNIIDSKKTSSSVTCASSSEIDEYIRDLEIQHWNY